MAFGALRRTPSSVESAAKAAPSPPVSAGRSPAAAVDTRVYTIVGEREDTEGPIT